MSAASMNAIRKIGPARRVALGTAIAAGLLLGAAATTLPDSLVNAVAEPLGQIAERRAADATTSAATARRKSRYALAGGALLFILGIGLGGALAVYASGLIGRLARRLRSGSRLLAETA